MLGFYNKDTRILYLRVLYLASTSEGIVGTLHITVFKCVGTWHYNTSTKTTVRRVYRRSDEQILIQPQ